MMPRTPEQVQQHLSPMLGESGYERRPLDAYFTPAWCTAALLDRVKLTGVVWEPACGRGDMVKVLGERGYGVMASDIADHGYPCAKSDFLQHGSPGDALFSICTNPPYDQAEGFIRHALELTKRAGGMVAMLLRHEFDCAATRRDLFDREPFARKLVLTRRPRWPDDPKGASPRHNFSWFIWNWNHAGPATLAYGPVDTGAENHAEAVATKREQLLRDRRESADAAGSPSRSLVGESSGIGVRKTAPASASATRNSHTAPVCSTTNEGARHE